MKGNGKVALPLFFLWKSCFGCLCRKDSLAVVYDMLGMCRTRIVGTRELHDSLEDIVYDSDPVTIVLFTFFRDYIDRSSLIIGAILEYVPSHTTYDIVPECIEQANRPGNFP
jgi:hypothetical protein